MKRRLVARVAVAVATLAAGAALTIASRARDSVARIEPGAIERRVIARAVIAPVDGVSEVRGEFDARVLRVNAKEGERVTAGQVLVELDPTLAELAVARATAEVSAHEATLAGLRRGGRREAQREIVAQTRAAERQLTLADDEAQRQKAYHESGAVSEVASKQASAAAQIAKEHVEALHARLEMLRSGAPDDVRAADYRLDAARAALRIAETTLARTRIVAPTAGIVLARRVDPGDVVRVIDPQVLFEIADPSRVELRAEVEELHTALVRVGAPVVVTAPGGGGGRNGDVLSRGEVARMGPQVARRSISGDPSELRADSLVRAVFVALAPGSDLGLPIGQRVEVRIDLEPRNVEARVPRSAVSLRDGRAVVDVARGPLREERAVQLGVADDRYIEVRGLEPGASVVVHDAR